MPPAVASREASSTRAKVAALRLVPLRSFVPLNERSSHVGRPLPQPHPRPFSSSSASKCEIVSVDPCAVSARSRMPTPSEARPLHPRPNPGHHHLPRGVRAPVSAQGSVERRGIAASRERTDAGMCRPLLRDPGLQDRGRDAGQLWRRPWTRVRGRVADRGGEPRERGRPAVQPARRPSMRTASSDRRMPSWRRSAACRRRWRRGGSSPAKGARGGGTVYA